MNFYFNTVKNGIIKRNIFKYMQLENMYSNITENNCKIEDMSKQDLLERIYKLENEIKQLKIAKEKLNSTGLHTENNEIATSFDFSRFKKRHVLLKLLYFGWNYQGYAGQDYNIKTIENELFKALEKSKLIESVATANYSKCGRTDKGVSAFSQVISIDLRTNLTDGKGVFTPINYTANHMKVSENEISYCHVINEILPEDIRILAWAPVDLNFNARYDCKSRTYKYYFIKKDLNIKIMEEASKYFIGKHDFRNFCKMDMRNIIVNYQREIIDISILPIFKSFKEGYEIYELTIKGYAFLWHQIRYMVFVLFLIGQCKETPEVIKELLNIDKYPRKPQFNLASDFPLILFETEYENIEWIEDYETILSIIKQLQNAWLNNAIKATIIQKIISNFENQTVSPNENEYLLIRNTRRKKLYKPLLERNCSDTLEERLEQAIKKKKYKFKWKNLTF